LIETIQGWINQAWSRLSKQSETAHLDAQALLSHSLQRPRVWVLAHPETTLNSEQIENLERQLLRLERGEPLAYVLGTCEFYGLELDIGPSVLIPRPETELMVEEALKWLRSHPERRIAADIGTGSGCIAIALAMQVESLKVMASDISPEALEVSRRNVERYQLGEAIKLVCADLLPAGMDHKFDLVCANLPYIPTGTLKTLVGIKYEPRLALDGGLDGLWLIRRLLDILPLHLAPGGLALIEIEAGEGNEALALAQGQFCEAEINVFQDLAGHDRILRIQI